MSSWSDRQSSIVTVSGWFSARMVERNFPPNMRIRGDSIDSTYSCPSVRHAKFNTKRGEIIGAPWNSVFPRQSGLTETPRVLLLRVQQQPTCDL